MLSYSIIKKAGIPGILLYIWSFLPFLISRGRTSENYNSIDSSAITQIAVIFIIFCYIFFNIKENFKYYIFLFKKTFLKYLFLYFFMCLISFIWSYDPVYVLWRSYETLVLFLIVLNLAIKLNFNYIDIAKWAVNWSFIFGVILYFIFVLNMQIDFNSLHGFGVYYFGSLLFFPLLYKDYKMFLVMFFIMIFATSTKSYLGFLLSIVFFIFFTRNLKIQILTFAVFLLISFIVLYINDFSILEILFPNKTEENIASGTGRLPVWEVLIDAALNKPFFGYGFQLGEREAASILNMRVVSAHNSFLSAVLSIGVFGMQFLVLFFLNMFFLCFKFRRNQNALLLLCCVTMSFIFSIFDNSIGTRISPAWLSTVILAIVIASYTLKNNFHENFNNK